MEPTIKAGSKVFVFQWAYAFREPKVGDIVIFRHRDEFWVKRIKKIEGSVVEVEGDNKGDSQKIGAIKKKDIIGKVLFIP
jgi:signal peptidase I